MGIATRSSAISIGLCFPIIGGILVALRFYTRWHQKTSKKIDDWLCLPAWLSVTGCCACLLTGVFTDVFVNAPVASPDSVAEQQHVLAQVTGALTIFWITSNSLIKLSILFFYRRIFVGRIFQVCNWTLISLSLLWLVYASISWILYCGTHVSANFEGGWAVCAPWGLEIQMAVFCLDSFIDVLLLILPVPFIWRLHLDISRKVIIVIIFLLGGLAFVAGLNNTIVQLVFLTEPTVADSAGQGNFFQGSSLLIYSWPVIEVGVGLIACNLPSLSFRTAHALPKQIRYGWNLLLSGIRSSAERLSLRSDSKQSHSPHHIRTREDSTASDWSNNRRGSFGHAKKQGPVVTISPIPSVNTGSEANMGSESRPAGNYVNGFIFNPMVTENEKVISGVDAV